MEMDLCWMTVAQQDPLKYVFDVNHGSGPGSARILQRILLRHGHPAEVHFHLYQLRVRLFQQDVIGVLAVNLNKFKMMVVVRELKSGFLTCLAALVKDIGSALPAVGVFAMSSSIQGFDDVWWAYDFAVSNHLRKFLAEALVVTWTEGAVKPFLSSVGADLLRRVVEIACKLYFAIADGCNLGNRAVESRFMSSRTV